MKNISSSGRKESERNAKIEKIVLEIMKDMKTLKENMIQYNFHLKMETVDISDYFPMQSDADINKFMVRDEEWNHRRKVLTHKLL